MPSRERVAALIERVEQGRYVEALQEFYAEDATMQENGNPPRVGLKALVAHERGVMAAFKEIRALPVQSWLVHAKARPCLLYTSPSPRDS